MTLFLKACPRCKGDVHETNDHFGDVKSCLQCGWSQDVEKVQSNLPFSIGGMTDYRDVLKAISNNTHQF